MSQNDHYDKQTYYKKLVQYLAFYFKIIDKPNNADFSLFPSNLEFYFEYQIQMTIKDDKKSNLIPQAEALFRMGNIAGHEVHPYFLFQEIRDFDRKNNDNHVLERKLLYTQIKMLCDELSKNIDTLGKDFYISINVNPRIFDDDFKDYYLKTIAKHPNINPKNVAIELVESSRYPVFSNTRGKTPKEQMDILEQINNFHKNMTILQAAGTRILLDDFNTDFANEEVLATYPFDSVKIDRGPVRMLADELKYIEENEKIEDYEVDKLLKSTIIAALLHALRTKEKEKAPLPTQIVLEGYEEEYKFLPQLINKHYGEALKEYKIGQSQIAYQGYAISKGFDMDQLVELVSSNKKTTIKK